MTAFTSTSGLSTAVTSTSIPAALQRRRKLGRHVQPPMSVGGGHQGVVLLGVGGVEGHGDVRRAALAQGEGDVAPSVLGPKPVCVEPYRGLGGEEGAQGPAGRQEGFQPQRRLPHAREHHRVVPPPLPCLCYGTRDVLLLGEPLLRQEIEARVLAHAEGVPPAVVERRGVGVVGERHVKGTTDDVKEARDWRKHTRNPPPFALPGAQPLHA
eukprot:CAMPEP_0173436798 /NCGR_PEP_ID=MMETSP1357-20121228/17232_1 /TAXON_ID=77926 /ORGANISM="Hemiselmis rufescens, Strain PCC563" /LENGTH=210 /DNA_ID=CAMNT_0014401933 /DNA_START=144 /DNA_END=772 /DNA_ORIENTATION=+